MKNTLLIFLIFFGLNLKAQDGGLDASFNSGTGTNTFVYTTALQNDGKILIGGLFTSYNGTSRNRIARLNSDGSLDTTFNPGTGFSHPLSCEIVSLAIQNDGKILIGGQFDSFNGTTKNNIVRINTDGSLDATFNIGDAANGPIKEIKLQNDGKILIIGTFTIFNGTNRNGITRLNSNGSIDTSFNPGTGCAGIEAINLQNDGKIIIGGGFSSYNGTNLENIARLNSDGSVDNTFNIGTGASFIIRAIGLQSDGKILIGGDFNSYNNATANNIARLNTDGTLDTSFSSGDGTGFGYIKKISVLSNGKILMSGEFSGYNNVYSGCVGIARINSDGSLDTTFDDGTGPIGITHSHAVQSDGKIIIGGTFTTYNGVNINHVARIISSTPLDTENFDVFSNCKIYPNPTNDIIHISFENLNNTAVTILDLNGRVLKTQKLEALENQINISDLTSGIYLFKIQSDEGAVTKQIIKN